MCTKFLADETKKVDKYINGLPDNIHGNVISARPKTLDEAIELTNDLMDQKLRTYAERHTGSKMKFDNNNQAQQIPKRQNVAQAYAIGTGEGKEYVSLRQNARNVFNKQNAKPKRRTKLQRPKRKSKTQLLIRQNVILLSFAKRQNAVSFSDKTQEAKRNQEYASETKRS
nr:hypothetical protein [Tanacetum cinerariifolium]